MALAHLSKNYFSNWCVSICSKRKFRLLLSIPLGTEMFHFPRCASYIRKITADDSRVSPLGHIRVKGYLAPHRIFSQPYHVLHRFLKPRHPPYTLCSCKERCIPLFYKNGMQRSLLCSLARKWKWPDGRFHFARSLQSEGRYVPLIFRISDLLVPYKNAVHRCTIFECACRYILQTCRELLHSRPFLWLCVGDEKTCR